ncbi:MAG TPA: hypothetical protein VH186_04090 [Chloroflexia bacterium]|nr:hypothetical protein [Chloroflexia bacterium]
MSNNVQRPAVLDNLGSSQINEMEQFAQENNRQSFDLTVKSYGWDKQTCDAVWQHLTHRASQDEAQRAFGNQQSQGGSNQMSAS